MPVKIENMEMPTKCWKCDLCVSSNGVIFCPLIGKMVSYNFGIDKECRLKEVKE